MSKVSWTSARLACFEVFAVKKCCIIKDLYISIYISINKSHSLQRFALDSDSADSPVIKDYHCDQYKGSAAFPSEEKLTAR